MLHLFLPGKQLPVYGSGRKINSRSIVFPLKFPFCLRIYSVYGIPSSSMGLAGMHISDYPGELKFLRRVTRDACLPERRNRHGRNRGLVGLKNQDGDGSLGFRTAYGGHNAFITINRFAEGRHTQPGKSTRHCISISKMSPGITQYRNLPSGTTVYGICHMTLPMSVLNRLEHLVSVTR